MRTLTSPCGNLRLTDHENDTPLGALSNDINCSLARCRLLAKWDLPQGARIQDYAVAWTELSGLISMTAVAAVPGGTKVCALGPRVLRADVCAGLRVARSRSWLRSPTNCCGIWRKAQHLTNFQDALLVVMPRVPGGLQPNKQRYRFAAAVKHTPSGAQGTVLLAPKNWALESLHFNRVVAPRCQAPGRSAWRPAASRRRTSPSLRSL
jgi:hypothetical protein